MDHEMPLGTVCLGHSCSVAALDVGAHLPSQRGCVLVQCAGVSRYRRLHDSVHEDADMVPAGWLEAALSVFSLCKRWAGQLVAVLAVRGVRCWGFWVVWVALLVVHVASQIERLTQTLVYPIGYQWWDMSW